MKKQISDGERPSIRSELRNELGWVIEGAERKRDQLIQRYPTRIFWAMVLILVVSIILRLTVLRADSSNDKKSVIGDSITELKKSDINHLSENKDIQRMDTIMQLQLITQQLLQRGHLSRKDSLEIIRAGETIKRIKNEKN